MGARLRDIAEGRRDALNIAPGMILIESGFNPREYTLAENRKHLDALKGSIREMGVRVPLLVRWDVGSEQAILIDGECRLRACLELIAEGVEIKSVPVLQEQTSNEADRLLLAITTNTGKPLSQWESGKAFRRLLGYGWAVDEIAKKTGHSVRFVKESLDLSDAPEEVREMLSSGSVTPALAVKTIREKGDGAAKILRERVSEAKAKGKSKAGRPKATESSKLLTIGDKLVEEIMQKVASWDELETLAKQWKKARR
jgi:ParB/RepB/Spo0J family partition protein